MQYQISFVCETNFLKTKRYFLFFFFFCNYRSFKFKRDGQRSTKALIRFPGRGGRTAEIRNKVAEGRTDGVTAGDAATTRRTASRIINERCFHRFTFTICPLPSPLLSYSHSIHSTNIASSLCHCRPKGAKGCSFVSASRRFTNLPNTSMPNVTSTGVGAYTTYSMSCFRRGTLRGPTSWNYAA